MATPQHNETSMMLRLIWPPDTSSICSFKTHTAGYAEDIMSVARKAGATGGTILHGRGTAREEDGKFFGLTIVPEKDILLILAGTDKSRDILEAIRTSEFLQQEGLGIAFCSGVEEFVPLGKK